MYVDDILVAGRNKSAIAEIKRALQKALDIKDLGRASLFLGMTTTRDKEHHQTGAGAPGR